MFPGIAADPAGHNQDAESVGLVEEFVTIGFAFEADGIEPHAANVGEVGIEFVRVPAEEHVGGPGGTADEDALAIYFEEAGAGFG